jgi:hypothetical protein
VFQFSFSRCRLNGSSLHDGHRRLRTMNRVTSWPLTGAEQACLSARKNLGLRLGYQAQGVSWWAEFFVDVALT